MSKEYDFELIYKSSWFKDNRSASDSWHGPDIPECYHIFKKLKEMKGFKTLTDVHNGAWLDHYHFVDVVQLPAYLCMQTSLTNAIADYCHAQHKIINIKKGQFLHPEDVGHILQKIYCRHQFPSEDIWVTERGTCFGYRDLVVDPRSLDILKRKFAHPVFLDIGHACRKYGIPSCDSKGGSKEFVFPLAKVAVALGCNIFVEVHPHPDDAKCDAATQIDFEAFEFLMDELIPLREGIKIATS